MITSKASPESTALYAEKFPRLKYKMLGSTGLIVSACGFGGYRIDYRVFEHFQALEYALLNGINLIDTSSNYSDGGSEILIRNVLGKLIKENKIRREEIVIVSKSGYIQGKIYEKALMKKNEGLAYPDIVEYSDKLWHCISPEFLRDSIIESRERMQVETIDVFLLHNPEYFLDSALTTEMNLDEIRHEFYNRIKKAFLFLESEVENGSIGCYGISSNSFSANPDSQIFTSAETCYNIAKNINTENNFRVVQFPFNLIETQAVNTRNQNAETLTVLGYSCSKNLGVLTNRPLNAIRNGVLTRLADFEVMENFNGFTEDMIKEEIRRLDEMESGFLSGEIDRIQKDKLLTESVTELLRTGKVLDENWKNFNTIENFNDVKKRFLIPRMNYAFNLLLNSEPADKQIREKLNRIAEQTNRTMRILDTVYGLKANIRSKEYHKILNEQITDKTFRNLPLSQKALLLLVSTGVSSVLVGMRQIKYVEDVINALGFSAIGNAEKLIDGLIL